MLYLLSKKTQPTCLAFNKNHNPLVLSLLKERKPTNTTNTTQTTSNRNGMGQRKEQVSK